MASFDKIKYKGSITCGECNAETKFLIKTKGAWTNSIEVECPNGHLIWLNIPSVPESPSHFISSEWTLYMVTPSISEKYHLYYELADNGMTSAGFLFIENQRIPVTFNTQANCWNCSIYIKLEKDSDTIQSKYQVESTRNIRSHIRNLVLNNIFQK